MTIDGEPIVFRVHDRADMMTLYADLLDSDVGIVRVLGHLADVEIDDAVPTGQVWICERGRTAPLGATRLHSVAPGAASVDRPSLAVPKPTPNDWVYAVGFFVLFGVSVAATALSMGFVTAWVTP